MSTVNSLSMNPTPSQSTSYSKLANSFQIEKETLKIDYKSKDGDTVTLNYQKVSASIYGSNGTINQPALNTANILSPEDGEKLRAKLKVELYSYKEALVKSFVEANGGTYQSATTGTEADAEVTDLEAKMPDYWNAENTSQRIVDFATSFLSSFKGESSDFFKTIKDAIETGFNQAKEMLGNLPGAVGNLASKTMKLTMEKLDAFEKQANAQQSQAPAPQPQTEAAKTVDVVA